MDEIKQKVDIVSIIGERVTLKKAGNNYKGLCPFHNEKSPSFMVSPELQIFKCFGCQKSGDVFTFLEEYEGMEFYEALKKLAEKTGIKLKSFGGSQRGYKDRLFEVNSVVSDFYHFMLINHSAGNKALDYLLNQRKLKPETINKFKLGFSPDVPLGLKSYVIDRKKITIKELSDAGNVYSSNGRSFDRFRGRVIFPLFDHRGNIIGFAGRTMPGSSKDLAKYINSPETPIYKKSQVLFGLNESRGEIKKAGVAVVVEGELDMISSFQAGIKNVVAIKGSALTKDQAMLLSRFAKTVTLALDADFAGSEAARRGIFIAEKAGLEVKVAKIVGFKDPDEAAREDPEKLKKFIDSAIGVWDFIIDFTFSKHKGITGDQKAKIAKELLPLLSQIENKITQSHYLAVLAGKLSIPIDAVTEEMRKVKNTGSAYVGVPPKVEEQTKTRREMLEERLLSLVFNKNPGLLKQKKYSKVIKSIFGKKIVSELENFETSVKISEFVKRIPPELKERFSDLVLKDDGISGDMNSAQIDKEMLELLREIEVMDLRLELESLATQISESENLKKKKKIKELEKRFSELTAKLSGLKEE